MKAVLQRVNHAVVRVGGQITGSIKKGILIFLAVSKDDTREDADYLAKKSAELRIFEDTEGKMNLSSLEVDAKALVVSQFTLYGDCRKGRRPSFDNAADPDKGKALYDYFIEALKNQGLEVETGQFQAMMDVELVNDGPVTLILESVKSSAK